MSELWTIGELAERVGRVLIETGGDRQMSGRIRAVPDTRTLRYYTTLGLLDPPLEFRGRTAFYGSKHLLQTVVIKRLQLQGVALVDVQQRMIGASDEVLEEWAAIPAALWSALQRDESAVPPMSERPRTQVPETLLDLVGEPAATRFWAASPMTTPPVTGSSGQLAVHWELAPGVRLVWEDAAELANPAVAARIGEVVSQIASMVREIRREDSDPGIAR